MSLIRGPRPDGRARRNRWGRLHRALCSELLPPHGRKASRNAFSREERPRRFQKAKLSPVELSKASSQCGLRRLVAKRRYCLRPPTKCSRPIQYSSEAVPIRRLLDATRFDEPPLRRSRPVERGSAAGASVAPKPRGSRVRAIFMASKIFFSPSKRKSIAHGMQKRRPSVMKCSPMKMGHPFRWQSTLRVACSNLTVRTRCILARRPIAEFLRNCRTSKTGEVISGRESAVSSLWATVR